MTLGIGTWDWDARAIWLAHAKVIYIEHNLYAQFFENGYIGGHPDYPVGFPALAASFANMIGTWNEVFPKAAVIFFLMPPLFITFEIFRKKSLQILFLIGLAIICRAYLFNGYMDALVALYAWAILILILQAEISRVSDLAEASTAPSFFWSLTVASFFCVLLMLKNEGLVISLLLFIYLAIFRRTPNHYQLRLVIPCAMLFYLVIWKIPLWSYGISNDLAETGLIERALQRLTNLEDIKLIAGYFFRYLDLFTIAFVLNFFRKKVYIRDFLLPIYFVVGYTAIIFFIYLSTPHDLNWHLYTSIKRVLMPILLVMLGSILFSMSPTYQLYVEKVK
jgi:hypothetical protein